MRTGTAAIWTRRQALASLAAAGVLFVAASCKKPAPSGRPAPAALGLDPQGNPRVSETDRCPMCAMGVFEHKSWASVIELDDGTTFYTCSARCGFGTVLQAEKFLAVSPNRIRRFRVADYLRPDKVIDADSAFLVLDSDVRGPMGLAIVAAASQEDAEVITKRHGGRVVRRPAITIETLMELKKRNSAAPGGA